MLWLMVAGCAGPEVGLHGRADAPPDGAEPDEDTAPPPEHAGGNHAARDDVAWLDGDPAAGIAPLPPDDDLHDAAVNAFFAEGTIYTFNISLPAASRAILGPHPRSWVDATFSTKDGSWPVKLMLKGTTSFQDLSGKAAFKISFVAADPTARFHGLKRLTLNAMNQDSSMLHEHTAYWLFRHRGVPAPRHTYARVFVDGANYGLHGVVETMDEQFLKYDLPHDHHGNLYEANVADFATGKTDRFEIEESDGLWEPPYDDIDAAIATIEAAPAEGYVAALRQVFDLGELMKNWAIDLVTTNVDGYAFFANNYFAYHGKKQWTLFPWGNDQCFWWYRDVTDFSRLGGKLITRCGDTPDCKAMLYSAIVDLLEDWQKGELEAMVKAETALIQADCDADPRAILPCDTAHVLKFVQTRPATVREELAAQP